MTVEDVARWSRNRDCEPTGRANARPMTGSAKQSISPHKEEWIASSLTLLAMTTVAASRSRRAYRASFGPCVPPSPIRGRRECRAPDAPDSRVCRGSGCQAHALVRSHRKSPGIPRAMVLTGSFALSPATGLFCHRRPRKLLPANLTPASGRQDHTTSPSARQAPSSLALIASTASCPASVTISSRPSVGQDGRVIKLICVFGKSEYFCKGGWTEGSIDSPGDLPVGQQMRSVATASLRGAKRRSNPFFLARRHGLLRWRSQ